MIKVCVCVSQWMQTMHIVVYSMTDYSFVLAMFV